MYQELREKAEKKVKDKMAFYTSAIVFTFTSVVLILLSFYLPSIRFWLRLPIPVFIMVLAVLYLSVFGLPTSGGVSEDWHEEEIEKEMVKLLRQKRAKLLAQDELSETEKLDLRELEYLSNNEDSGEDFV